ncbi:MAG: pyridoxal phosphate-dependent aminotransferase [Gemmiger sp.]|uniref:pyridoxal phosphate-dependent aminotransferase n=1 Tax=Gemmiger sp. TaxID=2049027 RepID=UPI002E75E34D|nr:pyridoxal phosphate-dependent aminotransferase [Gemmiger sp.]MEE0799701.1 pyridoxal phosphate-dependent aminotransferase [Gemmiger sp.]
MIAQHYKDMLGGKSVIREISEWSTARGAEIGYDNVFDYSLGNPSVPCPAEFTESCRRLLDSCDPVTLHGYSPTLTLPAVRAAVAKSLNRRFGMDYTADHIFMTSGAAGALAHALRCVAVPGQNILTFAPYFPEYKPYVEGAGLTLRVVPPRTEDFQIDFDAMEALLDADTAAVLINTPNNPSGAVYSARTLTELADRLKAAGKRFGHRIFLISDEPYREILFGGQSFAYPAKFYDDTLTCYSFSKSLSVPGERIGYLAACPRCEEASLIVPMCGQISRGIGHNCPSSMIQLAAADCLDVTSDLQVYETNMELIWDELKRLGFTVVKPDGTFYIFPKALEEDANAFCRKAMAYDLALVPGDTFGCPGYFRMAYCVGTEKVRRSFAALERFVSREYGIEV